MTRLLQITAIKGEPAKKKKKKIKISLEILQKIMIGLGGINSFM